MSDDRAPLRLGTRRSALALHQADLVRTSLQNADPALVVEIVEIVSDGDRDTRDLREIGERGIFVHALERSLRAGDIDAAVHSSKDLPVGDSGEQGDLLLTAWLAREDPRDALVGTTSQLLDLPRGATIATGSARRSASIKTVRSDLIPAPIRGNVATRIERAATRGDAACMLAMAGLVRLGITSQRDDIVAVPVDQIVPEAGQGAVVVQAAARLCARTGFDWSAVDHVATRRAVQLERELTRLLGGGCERPIGVHVDLASTRIHAFAAPSPDSAGIQTTLEVVGLELAPLLSVSVAADVDDAALWCAAKLIGTLAELLQVEVVA